MYKERIIDQVLDDVTSVFNAVNIIFLDFMEYLLDEDRNCQ